MSNEKDDKSVAIMFAVIGFMFFVVLFAPAGPHASHHTVLLANTILGAGGIFCTYVAWATWRGR